MKNSRFIAPLLLLLSAGMVLVSCSDDTEVDPNTTALSFRFSHNFDGMPVDNSTFNEFNYVNAHGDTLSISRLRYLVSDIILTDSDGNEYILDGHQLVDVTNGTGHYVYVADPLPRGVYTSCSFTFGFDEDDNIDQGYPDLNLAVWNWPEMLGGGYHFMQMEGMYRAGGVDKPYAYHHGTARVMEGVFEQNFFEPILGGFTLSKPFAEVEIKMDISEWYKNPNTWDLNQYDVMLMPNYDAQKLMQANGASVFSLGEIQQTESL